MSQEMHDWILSTVEPVADDGPTGEDLSELQDDMEFESLLRELINPADEDRPIDQIHCKECGRPIVIWADVELCESDLTCSRCKAGLTPEWEY